MIRKVPNMDAWVLPMNQLGHLCHFNDYVYRNGKFYELPLFSLKLEDPEILCSDALWWDRIILVKVGDPIVTQEELQEINKIWNEFYD